MGYYRGMEQLYICTDKKKQASMCNCRMCPMYGLVVESNGRGDYCNHMRGNIREPKISWCRTGIGLMWIAQAKPEEAVELIAALRHCQPEGTVNER